MAKGVKKIKVVKKTESDFKSKWDLGISDKLNYFEVENSVYTKLSDPSKDLITVVPNQFVYFAVAAWFEDTTDAEKQKDLTWMLQETNRVIISQKTISGLKNYGIKIPKKLSGVYTYYVEASLFGKRDLNNQSGLYVRGYCPPKITNSAWAKHKGGNDVRKTHEFSYGDVLHLNLQTEGLNGDFVDVTIFRRKTGADQPIFTYTGVKVIDGEVNLEVKNTHAWYSLVGLPSSTEEFYVKVKHKKKADYVSDGKDTAHARFLRIKPNISSKNIDISKSNAPYKIGKPNTNVEIKHACTFDQILLKDNQEKFEIFKKGITKFKTGTTETQYARFKVYFNFDQATIRNDAKLTLQYLVSFLLNNKSLSINLSGHADDRGTLNYNQTLSEKRAEAVKTFLVAGGLDVTRIKTIGYGEINPVTLEKTEKGYQKNRRVEIDFSYIEYNQKAVIYETVAGNNNIEKQILLSVSNRSNEACFRDEVHPKDKIIVFDQNEQKFIKNGDNITHPVYAPHADFPENTLAYLLMYLSPFSKIYNSYTFHINSCAYFADTQQPSVHLKVYPDIVWIGHFQYNSEKTEMPYYFHDKPFDLEHGISKVIKEIQESTVYKILTFFTFINPLQKWLINEVIVNYIIDQTDSFFYGMHTYHNRNIEKKGEALSLTGIKTNLLQQNMYAKYSAAMVIYSFFCIGLLIDLLLIYLTRGKNVPGKLKKISNVAKKATKVLDELEDSDIEIIPPAIAINAGMYYKKQLDGRLALVYEANIKAKPLVQIDFERKFDLVGLLEKTLVDTNKEHMSETDPYLRRRIQTLIKNSEKIKETLKKARNKVDLLASFKITGVIDFDVQATFNFLTQSYELVDLAENLIKHGQSAYIIDRQLVFEIKLSINLARDFKFFPLKPKIEAKVDFELQGSAALKVDFGVDTGNLNNINQTEQVAQGLYIAPKIYCSGISGKYYGKLVVSSKLFGVIIDLISDEKPTEFILVNPFEVQLPNIQLFNEKQ
jgi:outer membrane protein OmpA-like peptidoglycan-associated protein